MQRLHDSMLALRDDATSRVPVKVSHNSLRMSSRRPGSSNWPFPHEQSLPAPALERVNAQRADRRPSQPVQDPAPGYRHEWAREPSQSTQSARLAHAPERRARRRGSSCTVQSSACWRLRRTIRIGIAYADDSHRAAGEQSRRGSGQLVPRWRRVGLPLLRRVDVDPADGQPERVNQLEGRRVQGTGGSTSRVGVERGQPVPHVQGHARGSVLQGASRCAQKVQDQRRLASVRALHLLRQHRCVPYRFRARADEEQSAAFPTTRSLSSCSSD